MLPMQKVIVLLIYQVTNLERPCKDGWLEDGVIGVWFDQSGTALVVYRHLSDALPNWQLPKQLELPYFATLLLLPLLGRCISEEERAERLAELMTHGAVDEKVDRVADENEQVDE